ncbi:hypothetical protein Slin14017_G043760 [Septoria linicola]|nr:hypothetical protein Slin14017_G043760 [Septoria linicola]
MPAHASFSDDYVAEILKRDAVKKDQNRFVASGLGSLLSGRSRPRGEAPKPHARFLKNLVRDVDSHNAALKEKEERESRRRMWDLQRGKKKSRSRSPTSESRSRHDDRDPKRRHRSRSRDRHQDRDSKRRRRSLERYAPGSSRHKRARSRSPPESPERGSKHRHRHRSPDPSSIPKQERLRKEESRKLSPPRETISSKDDDDSDSDPLETIIGPKPPPPKSKARGRGAQNHSSTMDDHFNPSYNPKTDVNLGPEEDRDDWDMALEALRDRARWKQSGAERLRAAGFTEEEVSNWQNGTGSKDDVEKDIRNLKWSKKGEGREWDRGKVLEGDHVEQKAEWGRLKDT